MHDTPSPHAIELIERLVAFDTVSRNSNLELIEFIADYLAGHGTPCELVYNPERSKANLWASFGPDDVAGTVLSGHTDVVPVDGQDWSTDPFTVTHDNDALYGRGTADMKSYIALCLSRTETLTKAKLSRPVHFAFSFDEEIGCVGVPYLIDRLKEREVLPERCLIGEPTGMQVIRGHKGKLATRCHVHGLEGHSGLTHEGVNAVEAAAEAIAYLKRMARRHRDNGPFDNDYIPGYSTVHTGVVAGGSAINIVPNECSFDFEFRVLPADDPQQLLAELRQYIDDELLPEMRAVYSEARFEWTTLSSYPSLDSPEDSDVVRYAGALSGSTATGKVSFGTEGGLFDSAGIPAAICGPGHINVAHKPNEHVTLQQLAAGERYIDKIIQDHVKT